MAKGGHTGGHIDGYFELCGTMYTPLFLLYTHFVAKLCEYQKQVHYHYYWPTPNWIILNYGFYKQTNSKWPPNSDLHVSQPGTKTFLFANWLNKMKKHVCIFNH